MRRNFMGPIVAVALLAGLGWYISGPLSGASEYTLTVTEKDGTEKQLPAVGGGDPANPISGSESDNDPRTPPVYGGQITKSWTELDALLGAQASYTDCMNRTLGMKWKSDVPRFKATEGEGYRTTFIAAILTTASDEKIREIAKRDDPSVNDKTPIIREDKGFVNTRGIENGGCEEFVDLRSVVRTSHGIVEYNADGTPKGVLNDRGIFATCKNGWRLVKEIGPKPTSPTAPGGTTVVSTTTGTTTPQCEGPCTTTTKPPDCTQPCGEEQKDPSQDPGAKDKVGGNDGKNTDQSQGTFIPDNEMTRPAETPHQNQSPVVNPPESPPNVNPNPNPGPVQTVQPSTQPPNHGVVPTSLPPAECNPLFHDNCPSS